MRQSNKWVYRAGDLARDGWETVVDSAVAGWSHTGIRVGSLQDGAEFRLAAENIERIIVPLEGSFRVMYGPQDSGETQGTVARLQGRVSVFDGPTDVLYLGTSTAAVITGVGRIIVAEAPTTLAKPSVFIPRAEVPVELRGAGRSSRQVHNFGTPAVLDAAKLIVCEVITPAENWSSFPAHKHDENIPGHESRLEEIYYFESAVTRGVEAPAKADPFGMFSTYSSPVGTIDINAQVRTGDVVLVPFGYHGPAAAAPGYDLYYLNVMAGPDPDRVWNISDDPAHGWIRETWEGQDVDPRLPYTPRLPDTSAPKGHGR